MRSLLRLTGVSVCILNMSILSDESQGLKYGSKFCIFKEISAIKVIAILIILNIILFFIALCDKFQYFSCAAMLLSKSSLPDTAWFLIINSKQRRHCEGSRQTWEDECCLEAG